MNDNCEMIVDNANLWVENQKLQSNWNSLREWINENYIIFPPTLLKMLLDKMNELEGKDKE